MILTEQNNLDQLVSSAVKQFWTSRTSLGASSQEGSRGSVIGGKNLDGFSDIIKAVAQHCGIRDECIITNRNTFTKISIRRFCSTSSCSD